ncbi:uncharacterized protein N7458_010248 [Penicillium daleae]|uniref:Uncharacterized protein n=1 Tax=Penicillium daleae TaxID=63821 RepID=A0AAD6BZ05_9EURO|nr:uncharacterized protein N7458_010248 [Penicillium daleae]KAJ5439250.1 hypothetical protein N7458_010248 [Penicillium daleae]
MAGGPVTNWLVLPSNSTGHNVAAEAGWATSDLFHETFGPKTSAEWTAPESGDPASSHNARMTTTDGNRGEGGEGAILV